MRGRKQKPTALKKLEGNPGRRPLPVDEPIAPPGAPEMPPNLSKEAQKLWPKKVKELMEIGVLSPVHGELLAMLCEAIVDEIAAKLQIRKEGAIIDTPFGQKAHPAVKLRRDAAHLIAKIAVEFGMTPSSATRATKAGAGSKKDGEPENPAMRLLKRANSAG